MGSDYDGMVIRPPLERISSGKVFKPSSKLRNKYWFEAIITALILWVVTIVTFFGALFLISSIASDTVQFNTWMNYFWEPVNFWFWLFDLGWLLPAIIFIPIYLNSFEYSVRAESGEASAEIYTKKGIITVTRKHVPIYAITNVTTKVGIFDRIFKIGSVEVETAASRGIYEEGPEEKIVGIVFYNELRDYILSAMRQVKSQNVITTETQSSTFDEPLIKTGDSFNDAILEALDEIRTLLRSIAKKLDKEMR